MEKPHPLLPLETDWTLQEWQFPTRPGVIPGLVRRIRQAWYSVAAQWAVRHLIQQQRLINTTLQEELRILKTNNQALTQQVQWLASSLSEQEQTQAHLTRQIAELTLALQKMKDEKR
jgi:hypothetical protein